MGLQLGMRPLGSEAQERLLCPFGLESALALIRPSGLAAAQSRPDCRSERRSAQTATSGRPGAARSRNHTQTVQIAFRSQFWAPLPRTARIFDQIAIVGAFAQNRAQTAILGAPAPNGANLRSNCTLGRLRAKLHSVCDFFGAPAPNRANLPIRRFKESFGLLNLLFFSTRRRC